MPEHRDADTPAALTPRERDAVIHRIVSLMTFWGITPDELAGAPISPIAPPPPAAAQAPKYRHPVSGDTWDGQGEHPDWLRRALLKEGYTVQQLRDAVNAATVPSDPDATGDHP